MEKVIKHYLEEAKVGRKQSYRNLSIFPLLSPYETSLDFITLDEALTGAFIEISEVDESGSVPELKVINKSEKMILILDGEELVGSKQNRIVNTTILIQAKSTTVIPVSCVEQGRWSYDTPRFYSQKRMMSAGMRAMKSRQVHDSVRYLGRYQADQGAIWDEISAKAERMAAESPSMAMSGIFEKERDSIGDYVKHFRLTDMQVGAVFAIHGNVVGMDCFGKHETFTGVFEKLVQSYALDAIDWFDEKNESKAMKADVTKFLKATQNGAVESRPSVGLGSDIRLESEDLTGFALALDDQILHLSVFVQKSGGNGDRLSSRMQRFSNRRRFRS
jgi:hypothetical protein